MQVIGYRRSSFKGSDGQDVKGYNIYCTYPLDKGEGDGSDRFFLTDARLAQCGYEPGLGDEIKVEYNRYGKVAGVQLVG